MKPTILLTGKTGQVGFELNRLLPRLGKIVAPDRNELDLLKPESVRRVIRETRPQVIVNAAAYTAVDAAERDEVTAEVVNSDAVGVLAEEANKIGAPLIHYSTDYVFDGEKKAPYVETDAQNPVNVYGKTKLAGEEAIRSSGVPHLIFRTCWVYATRGRNFLLTILRLAIEREELKIVDDQVGAPTCAADLATATAKILAEIFSGAQGAIDFSCTSESYHMTAPGQTSWHGFAKAILEEATAASLDLPWLKAATKGRPLVARRVVPISTAEFGSPTQRPLYSILSNERLKLTFGVVLPDWRA
jgi:dTDP-4-dehydrorhamnose reductase